MSVNTREVCGLCLKTICDDNLYTIKEIYKNTFNKLLLRLKLEASLIPAICCDCEKNFEKLVNIMTCIGIEKRSLLSCVDYDEEIKMDHGQVCLNAPEVLSDDFNGYKKCWFCIKITSTDCLTILNQTEEYLFMVDMLKKYVPELNFLEELATCESCVESLQILCRFIENCFDINGKIKKYVDNKNSCDNIHDELNDEEFKIEINGEAKVSHHVVNTVRMKQELRERIDDTEEESTAKSQIRDEHMKSEKLGLCVENKEIDIKTNDSTSLSGDIYLPQRVYQCQDCIFKTLYRASFRRHSRKLKHSDIVSLECTICPYKMKTETDFNTHLETHHMNIKRYKCENCSYKTYEKHCMEKHLAKHEGAIFHKCQLCSYQTKAKYHLKNHHRLNHTSPTEYKCSLCPYVSKTNTINRHMKNHRSPTEYKCSLCPYVSKTNTINHHMKNHRSPTKYKCSLCPYTSNFNTIRTHMKKHQNKAYACKKCNYKTEVKTEFAEHLQSHKAGVIEYWNNSSKMYECDSCLYESRYPDGMKKHLLTFNTPLKRAEYVCKVCSYQAKCTNGYNIHSRMHEEI